MDLLFDSAYNLLAYDLDVGWAGMCTNMQICKR